MSNPIPATDEEIAAAACVEDTCIVCLAEEGHAGNCDVGKLIARIESDRATIAELQQKAEKDFEEYRKAFEESYREGSDELLEAARWQIAELREKLEQMRMSCEDFQIAYQQKSAEVRRLEDLAMWGGEDDIERESRAILARRESGR